MSEGRSRDGRWTRWLLVAGITVLLLGSAQLTVAMLREQGTAEEAARRASEWHLRLALELPVEEGMAWREAATRDPLRLLRVCAVEAPEAP